MTVIGLILNLFGAIGVTFLTIFSSSDLFRDGFEEGYTEGMMDEGLEAGNEVNLMLNLISGLGWWIVFVAVLGIIAGILAMIFYAGNKKPKAASIILIVAAVIVGFGTLLAGLVPALLYLIAGIIGLVRKPPQTSEESDTFIEV
jgi:hypothetical protein